MPQRHEVTNKVNEILDSLEISHTNPSADWNQAAGGALRIAVDVFDCPEEIKEKAEALIRKEYGNITIYMFDQKSED